MSIATRLLVLSVYPEDQAGTRLRAHQFEPLLTAAGVDVEYWSFLSLADSRAWFGGAGRAGRVLILLRSVVRLVRLRRALDRATVVLVLREVLPIASLVVERAAARRAPVVWDVDDAVWTPYPRLFMTWLPERLRRSTTKYEQLASLAAEVWAGSELLAAWCRGHAEQVVVVPTVVEVSSAAPSSGRSGGAAWVGSPSTAPFLEQVLPALAGSEPPLQVDCVGAEDVATPGVEVRARPWSEQAERELLASARVGLYPIDEEHPLGAAKAGLKAVLYMAHGVPSVVTPTPSVAEIVRDGVDGVHARTPEQWGTAVSELLRDDDRWARMAASGRRRALEHYSLEAWGPRVVARVVALGRR